MLKKKLAIRQWLGRAPLVCLSVALPALCGLVQAQPAQAQPLPVAAYMAPADFAQVSISPNGRFLAALSPLKGKRNLVVLDLENMKSRAVTTFSNFDVIGYHWVGSEFLVFNLGTLDTPTGAETGDGGGLFAVRVDGSDFRKLQPTLGEQIANGTTIYRRLDFAAVVPGSSTEIIAMGNLRTTRTDVYKVDLTTGQRKLLTFNTPGLVASWFLDEKSEVRGAVVFNKEDATEAELVRTIMVRDTADSPWREVASFTEADKGRRWTPVGFAPDNKNLIVSSTSKRATSAYFLFDVDKKELGEMLIGHPRYDAAAITGFMDRDTSELVGFGIDADRRSVVYIDPTYASLHEALQKVFPDEVVQIQRTTAGRTLVTTFSDRKPHTYHLYDEKAKSLKQLLRSRRDLNEQHLVAMRPFLLKTRDGLEIPSYYFLPADYQPGQRLPTVVHVHGGPHVRADIWGPMSGGGVREAQLLASRGYAVVLPNHRITPGFGGRIYEAGFGQVGRKMSDDHEDAARWAVQQGFADASRICITGGSYGGYASLWATVRSAEVFKCAAAGFAIGDMELQQKSTQTDYARSRGGVATWKRLLGVEGEDWAPAREVSPALHAERSSIPLFIYAGANDRRTPVQQTELMIEALRKAGKPPELVMIKAEEGHGYGKLENNIELYEAKLKFFERHIGAGSRNGSVTATPPVTQQ
ncbi:prolyl oligopeptidase family serine peptidase [Pelomonas sp. SE-A7]|uniref:S9 family peptidase n=1 Tax=Pelomonas sp. SE-A7 TaxID=3054953 RepID=UPI00259CD8FB|nr:prolyl oligopeptidase family serine peptidase [Pelomonas sp. SE-A7]MDM4767848.1 prolyl oligopeptidase family serine peptidase [Pelomonas sp. SE-A7]